MSAIDNATPRPWHASFFQVYAANGDRVAHTGMGQLPPPRSHEAEANAALIVRAVNERDELIAQRDELVAALERCRDELSVVRDGSTGGVPNNIVALIPEAIAAADSILTKVKAERP